MRYKGCIPAGYDRTFGQTFAFSRGARLRCSCHPTNSPSNRPANKFPRESSTSWSSTMTMNFAARSCGGSYAAAITSSRRATQSRPCRSRNGGKFDLALLDMVMPGMSGVDLTEKLKQCQSDCEVILLTGQATVESAVRAMKLGAFDYLTKPCPLAELEVIVEKAVARRKLTRENAQLKEVLARSQRAPEMIGNSPAMQEVYRLIDRAGPTDKAILIQGESGTGKELVARALHRKSLRSELPLVVINCAALAETLLESELFGHEKGSFTGAIAAKPGLFEIADGGTLFIDEIGEMPGALQPKLLRVLEDGSMRRIGSVKERRVDVRILAATNRNMEEEVKAGRFREDLYYRINVMSLHLPPLRERAGDVGPLVRRFLGAGWQIEPEALAALERYRWPGNIRQLINAVDRAKILADNNMVRLGDLPRDVLQQAASPRARPYRRRMCPAPRL